MKKQRFIKIVDSTSQCSFIVQMPDELVDGFMADGRGSLRFIQPTICGGDHPG